MKKVTFSWGHMLGLTMVALLSTFSLSAFGQSKASVKGEVLDMNCYMAAGKHGASHQQCAMMCLKGGAPAGLLTSTGKVYLLVEDHSNPDPYAEARKYPADQIEVSGKAVNHGGVEALVVEKVTPMTKSM